MKLVLILMVCALAAAAPNTNKITPFEVNAEADTSVEGRNILVNALIRQLFTYIRHIINNGSTIFGVPPLDPLDLERYHLYVPAGIINLDLELEKILVTGIGGFVVHKSNLDLRELSFDIDISVPLIDIAAEKYDLLGDFLTAIPLYGKGRAQFKVDGFRVAAKLYLKQSDDGLSVLIDNIQNVSFKIPSLKSKLTGAIGGGDIDGVVNSMIEDVILDYINRFQGAISHIASNLLVDIVNPVLDKLDTWRYIAVLLPRA